MVQRSGIAELKEKKAFLVHIERHLQSLLASTARTIIGTLTALAIWGLSLRT